MRVCRAFDRKPGSGTLCGKGTISVGRRFEDDRDIATSASRTHQPRLEARKREVRASSAIQRVEVELLSIDASSDGFRALTIAIGAPHVHIPTEASRHPQGLDFHENKNGTFSRVVKPPDCIAKFIAEQGPPMLRNRLETERDHRPACGDGTSGESQHGQESKTAR